MKLLYYQWLNLLGTPPKSYGTIRRYEDDALERVQFIKRAQRLGFSLAEIIYLLDPKRAHHRAHFLARSKLAELAPKLADMVAMRSALAVLVTACESGTLVCNSRSLLPSQIPNHSHIPQTFAMQ